tara:strand:+ start:1949 stop:2263 length:315 start_codon:yes stop_codon:yes gene_type:complete
MTAVTVVGTQLVAVFFSVCGPLPVGDEPITLVAGSLLQGFGPSQSKAKLAETTIAHVRETWGDDSIGGDLNPATKAWLHSTDHGNGGVTTVLVNMPVVAGWGDE